MMAPRLNTFHINAPLPNVSNFLSEKLMALPTANRNDGKTRSVGVKPNHAAWSSGEKAGAEPGLFTIIIKTMVIPRNTSSARNRSGFWVISIIKIKKAKRAVILGDINKVIKTVIYNSAA